MTFSERHGNVSDRVRIDTVLDRTRDIFQNGTGMKSSRSLLVLHYNTHLVKYFTFDLWKQLIDEKILQIKKRRELFGSNAQIVWKTMTAVGYTAARYEFRAMYHTAFVSICYLTSGCTVIVPRDV